MINLVDVAPPLLGAVIGYGTNWLAIKMLFKPTEPKFVFGHQVPFTPGLIAKEKDRMAVSIADMVCQKLLTVESFSANLKSDRVKSFLRDSFVGYFSKLKVSDRSVRAFAADFLSEQTFVSMENELTEKAASIVAAKLRCSGLGEVIADKVISGSDNIIVKFAGSAFKPQIVSFIQNFLDANAGGLSKRFVAEAFNEFLATKVCNLVDVNDDTISNLASRFIETYERMVDEKLPSVMIHLDLKSMIEQTIRSMDVEEMENIVLGVMKKELGAITVIGGVLGFVIGVFQVVLMHIA